MINDEFCIFRISKGRTSIMFTGKTLLKLVDTVSKDPYFHYSDSVCNKLFHFLFYLTRRRQKWIITSTLANYKNDSFFSFDFSVRLTILRYSCEIKYCTPGTRFQTSQWSFFSLPALTICDSERSFPHLSILTLL